MQRHCQSGALRAIFRLPKSPPKPGSGAKNCHMRGGTEPKTASSVSVCDKVSNLSVSERFLVVQPRSAATLQTRATRVRHMHPTSTYLCAASLCPDPLSNITLSSRQSGFGSVFFSVLQLVRSLFAQSAVRNLPRILENPHHPHCLSSAHKLL